MSREYPARFSARNAGGKSVNRELMPLSSITLVGLLNTDVWGPYAALLDGLQGWQEYDLFFHFLTTLKTDVLYQSSLHGQGHIERALLLSALINWREGLDPADDELLYLAASYHDVGRVSDGYDTEHGTRSAVRLEELTGRTGEDLRLMQGAVAAHSRPDRRLEETVSSYRAADFPHAVALAQLLKDADGLDRVRIQDLNPDFLRHESARELAPFAQYLFDLYCSIGAAAPFRLPQHWTSDSSRA